MSFSTLNPHPSTIARNKEKGRNMPWGFAVIKPNKKEPFVVPVFDTTSKERVTRRWLRKDVIGKGKGELIKFVTLGSENKTEEALAVFLDEHSDRIDYLLEAAFNAGREYAQTTGK